jgi:flagellar hook-associated protein FlgK
VHPGNLWLVVSALAVVSLFVGLERTPPARASFTLVGLVDCGLKSGATCSLGITLVLVSDDSGVLTRYTIDLSWLKGGLPRIDQDDQLSIEIEKLPDGTLMALNLVDVSDQRGTGNTGQIGAKTATTTTSENVNNEACTPVTVTTSLSSTTSTTIPATATTTATSTSGTTVTGVVTTTIDSTTTATRIATVTTTETTTVTVREVTTVTESTPGFVDLRPFDEVARTDVLEGWALGDLSRLALGPAIPPCGAVTTLATDTATASTTSTATVTPTVTEGSTTTTTSTATVVRLTTTTTTTTETVTERTTITETITETTTEFPPEE